MSSEESPCKVCGVPSSLRCGRCKGAVYCSKDHQMNDWKFHKKSCFPIKFKIEENETLGRHIVAKVDISRGEVVLEEDPLFTGPSVHMLTTSSINPVCLGCYVPLNPFRVTECSKCGWPLCTSACEEREFHQPECRMTIKYRKNKVVLPEFQRLDYIVDSVYQFVNILRCLYMKDTDKGKWKKFSKLVSHTEERKKKMPAYRDKIVSAVNFVKNYMNYDDFTEEDIWEIVGILEVNAHELPLGTRKFLSVYEMGSLVEHDCRSNCSKSFCKSGKLVIRAVTELRKGDHISITYGNALEGLTQRQFYLHFSKHFRCKCVRCTDPTELGTNFNSIRCLTAGCKGYITPVVEPGSELSFVWYCAVCERQVEAGRLEHRFLKFSEQNLSPDDPDAYTNFLRDFGRDLHRNNHYMVQCKLRLLEYYEPRNVSTESEDVLETIITICKDLIDVTSKLAPSETRLLGLSNALLARALLAIRNKRLIRRKFDEEQSHEALLECRQFLQKSYEFLKYEPRDLHEGKRAVEAMDKIREIDKSLSREP